MEDPVLRVILVTQKSCELPGIPVHHRKIEGSEILIEGEICKIVVDVEEKGVLEVLWRLGIRNPIKFVYIISFFLLTLNDLNGFTHDIRLESGREVRLIVV